VPATIAAAGEQAA
jgi:integrase/recombinase XerD